MPKPPQTGRDMADRWDKVIGIAQLVATLIATVTLVTVVVVLALNVTITLPGGASISPSQGSVRTVVSTTTATTTLTTTLTSGVGTSGIHQINITYTSGNSLYWAYVQNYTHLVLTYTNGQAGTTPGYIKFGPAYDDPAYQAGGCVSSDTTTSTPCNVNSNFQGSIQLIVQGAYVFFPGYSGNPPLLYGY